MEEMEKGIWLYFNKKGNSIAKISHNEVLRQKASGKIILAFDKDNPIFANVGSNELIRYKVEYIRPGDNKVNTYSNSGSHKPSDYEIRKYFKIKNNEMSYGMVEGQEYYTKAIDIGEESGITDKYGNLTVIVTLSKISVTTSDGTTTSTEIMASLQGSVQLYIEPTYGKTGDAQVNISASEKQILENKIDIKLDKIGDTATRLKLSGTNSLLEGAVLDATSGKIKAANPSENAEVANKSYVDSQDATTLNSAKSYTFSQNEITSKDTSTLNAAKAYTYSQNEITAKIKEVTDVIGTTSKVGNKTIKEIIDDQINEQELNLALENYVYVDETVSGEATSVVDYSIRANQYTTLVNGQETNPQRIDTKFSQIDGKISALENAGYLVEDDLSGYATESWVEGKNYLIQHQSLTDLCADLDLSINNYVLSIQLKNKNGTNLSQAKTVSLPIESVVVSGRYDSSSHKVVLTLSNNDTIEFGVGDLIDGLQSEITSSNKLSSDLVDDTNKTHKFVSESEKSTWNNKQNAITSSNKLSYDLISGTPTIPTNNNQLTNGAGYITSSGSCASATKATKDGNGNVITSTYATKTEVSNTYVAKSTITTLPTYSYDSSTGILTITPGSER